MIKQENNKRDVSDNMYKRNILHCSVISCGYHLKSSGGVSRCSDGGLAIRGKGFGAARESNGIDSQVFGVVGWAGGAVLEGPGMGGVLGARSKNAISIRPQLAAS